MQTNVIQKAALVNSSKRTESLFIADSARVCSLSATNKGEWNTISLALIGIAMMRTMTTMITNTSSALYLVARRSLGSVRWQRIEHTKQTHPRLFKLLTTYPALDTNHYRLSQLIFNVK